MQHLKTGETFLAEAPAPAVAPGCVSIRSVCSLVSAGTERMLVEFGNAGFIGKARAQPEKVKQVLDKMRTDGVVPTVEAVCRKLDEPIPLGYCNVGVVDAAQGFEHGERVVSNGPHAEVVCVPERLCAKIPGNVSDEDATFAVLASVGLQGVKLCRATAGERVVVYGLGLIGLLSVQILKARGCEVFGVDIDPARLKLAEQFGAQVCNAATGDPVGAVVDWADGPGAHAVLITASAKKDDIAHKSAQMCRKHGRIVLVGVVDLNLRRGDYYEKELSFQVSCSYGSDRSRAENSRAKAQEPQEGTRVRDNFQEVLSLLESGKMDVKPLITHRVAFADASQAYEVIKGDRAALGVILDYGNPDRIDRMEDPGIVKIRNPVHPVDPVKTSSPVIGMIGAGHFVKATLMPALGKTNARVKYVASRGGTSAAYVARKFGCENAVSDYRLVLDDEEVNAVAIATQHDLHARLVCEALEAGKHVFVEKPLCLNREELDRINRAYRSSDEGRSQIVLVGFNRRFSPHTVKVKELIAGRHGPLCMNMTVNAGDIPADHWVHDPVKGGGRIIGEGCHFIDLLSYIAGSPVATVSAVMAGNETANLANSAHGGPAGIRDDRMSIVLGFADGSVGTINYFANGPKSYPKEMLAVFCDGKVARIDNFRVTRGYGVKGFGKFKTWRQDKGHAAEMAAFVKCVSADGESPIPFDELLNVTRASFAAVESAREGGGARSFSTSHL